MQPTLPEFDCGNSCLFLDVDGTLIDIAPHPDAVVVPDDLLADLAALHVRLDGALALVSGRAIAVLDRLFAPLRLPAAGAHGAEMRLTPSGSVERVAGGDLPGDIGAAVAALADDVQGLLVEDKGVSIAVHYRANPSADGRVKMALEALAAGHRDADLTILPGHFVYELKRIGTDKGQAVARFMAAAPFAGRRPVVIGDDVTDEAAFAKAPLFGGHAIAVGREVSGVTATLSSPADVRGWIAKLASRRKVAA